MALEANTTYFLLSQEVTGGDKWYDYDSTLTPTGGFTINGTAWVTNGSSSFALTSATNNGYIPVKSKFSTGGWNLAGEMRYIYDGTTVIQQRDQNNVQVADTNIYRFSSEEWHAGSTLYYFGNRFYSPELQRWISRGHTPLPGPDFAFWHATACPKYAAEGGTAGGIGGALATPPSAAPAALIGAVGGVGAYTVGTFIDSITEPPPPWPPRNPLYSRPGHKPRQ